VRPICQGTLDIITKHHQPSTNGNNLLKARIESKSLEKIVKGSFGKNAPLYNAGQPTTSAFLELMKPMAAAPKLPGRLRKEITEDSRA